MRPISSLCLAAVSWRTLEAGKYADQITATDIPDDNPSCHTRYQWGQVLSPNKAKVSIQLSSIAGLLNQLIEFPSSNLLNPFSKREVILLILSLSRMALASNNLAWEISTSDGNIPGAQLFSIFSVIIYLISCWLLMVVLESGRSKVTDAFV